MALNDGTLLVGYFRQICLLIWAALIGQGFAVLARQDPDAGRQHGHRHAGPAATERRDAWAGQRRPTSNSLSGKTLPTPTVPVQIRYADGIIETCNLPTAVDARQPLPYCALGSHRGSNPELPGRACHFLISLDFCENTFSRTARLRLAFGCRLEFVFAAATRAARRRAGQRRSAAG